MSAIAQHVQYRMWKVDACEIVTSFEVDTVQFKTRVKDGFYHVRTILDGCQKTWTDFRQLKPIQKKIFEMDRQNDIANVLVRKGSKELRGMYLAPSMLKDLVEYAWPTMMSDFEKVFADPQRTAVVIYRRPEVTQDSRTRDDEVVDVDNDEVEEDTLTTPFGCRVVFRLKAADQMPVVADEDGFWWVTKWYTKYGKKWYSYAQKNTGKRLIVAATSRLGRPVVKSVQHGPRTGIWLSPLVAFDFAQWIHIDFGILVSEASTSALAIASESSSSSSSSRHRIDPCQPGQEKDVKFGFSLGQEKDAPSSFFNNSVDSVSTFDIDEMKENYSEAKDNEAAKDTTIAFLEKQVHTLKDKLDHLSRHREKWTNMRIEVMKRMTKAEEREADAVVPSNKRQRNED
jgi:hypothetical protein